ncbi:hypothetical protein BDA96_01G149200 [Sorghum bicolor]|uniref:DUF834 domain-containing protein n=1 Tax=Sorghum bicolor TaxID=4558 RepID=A0A921UXN9_SORBI|nr:hypothetical protein BDA96_01G149200 [Sorghum bicolor]
MRRGAVDTRLKTEEDDDGAAVQTTILSSPNSMGLEGSDRERLAAQTMGEEARRLRGPSGDGGGPRRRRGTMPEGGCRCRNSRGQRGRGRRQPPHVLGFVGTPTS